MTKSLLALVLLVAFWGRTVAADQVGMAGHLVYRATPEWRELPPGSQQLGSMHGDIAVASNGEVYVSMMDPDAGILVFTPDGHYLRKVPGAPNDFHGFIIHREKAGEFIYGSRLGAPAVLKMTLDGKVVLTIPASAFPDRYKDLKPLDKKLPPAEAAKDPTVGKPYLRLTGVAVTPEGDIFVTDGYASSYVHRFDRHGKYLASFGGKDAPYNFRTLHKIAIDTRFSPARIIACDRANNRVVHLSLEGKLLGVVASGLRLPAAVAIRGDYAAIGELAGRVTVLDKAGRVVAEIGTDDKADEAGSNKTEPAKWRPGIVTAPHGVAFDARGDIFVSEYTLFGRVHRFDLVP